MRIALCQLGSSTTDLNHNIEMVMRAANQCKSKNCDVLVFPEATQLAFGGDLQAACAQSTAFVHGLQQAAIISHAVVIAGGFRPADGNDARVKNTLFFVNEHGLVHCYDKIHGFNALGYREIDTVQPGTTVPKPYMGIGCAICYDLRFPSMFCTQARNGADIIVVAASWADGDLKAEQWETLSRARALDSCSFIVTVGQPDPSTIGNTVPSNQPSGIGSSLVWAPDGKCLSRLGRGNAIELVDIPTSDITRYRSIFRVLENEVPGIDL